MGKRTHGNCACWTQASTTHVYCDHDLFGGCWYSKNGNAQKCKDWRLREDESVVDVTTLEATYYDGDAVPFSVVAIDTHRRRFRVARSHVMQAYAAKWKGAFYHYTENGIGYTRQTLTGEKPLRITIVKETEAGAANG